MSEAHPTEAWPVTLRPVVPEDEPFLFDLYASTRWDEMASWGLDDTLLHQMLHLQFAGQQGTYRAQYPTADHQLILYAAQPIGRILVDRSEEALVLVDVALLPAMRRRGIGTKLLQALLAEARDKKLPVRLSVMRNNPARRLYVRLGFESLDHDSVYERMMWHPGPTHHALTPA